MKCEKCGFEFSDGALACPQCGKAVTPGAEETSEVTEEATPKKKKKPLWLLFIIIPLAVLLIGGSCLCCVGVLGGGGVFATLMSERQSGVQNEVQTDEAEEQLTPDVVGLDEEKAIDRLLSAGYTEVTGDYEYSEDFASGVVISQSCDEGDPVPLDGTIEIVVSLGSDKNPDGYDQLIRVMAFEGSSEANLVLCEWKNNEWVEVFSCYGVVGKQGVSIDYGEGKKVTPMGTFPLGFVMTESGYLGSNYIVNEVVDKYTCIVDDEDSVFYNTLQDYRDLPRGTGYEPVGKTICSGDTNAMIFIEHNGDGYSSEGVVAGMGSAITICGVENLSSGTAGCIDVSSWDMDTIISMLDYTKNPHIEISVI